MANLSVDEWALRKLVLDRADGTISSPMIANAADARGRGIMLTVVQGGTPANLTGCTGYLVWRHENGNQDLTPFEMVDAAKGEMRVYYPPAMMYAGKVEARISIYMGGEVITGSRNFAITVERNPVDENSAVTDENFSIFVQAVVDLNEATARANAATDAANAAANSANEKVSAAVDEIVPVVLPPAVDQAVADKMAEYSAVSFSVNPDDGGLDITYSY